jgi:hypothetical protein
MLEINSNPRKSRSNPRTKKEKNKEKYNHEFLVFDLSQEELEKLTLRRKGEMRVRERGEGDEGFLILFNRAITQSQFCL